MRPPKMTPSMQKKIRSSTSFAAQLEPGRAARRRASHHAPAKPSRYMMPYQCTCTGPSWNATGLKPGYLSMRRVSLAGLARHAAKQRLQIACLGNRRMHRVVGRLAGDFEDLHAAPAVARRCLYRGDELLDGKMIGARARHQQSLLREQRQRELIQLAVARLTLRQVFLALDERRRIEDHDIEALTPLAERLERVESVGAQRLQA